VTSQHVRQCRFHKNSDCDRVYNRWHVKPHLQHNRLQLPLNTNIICTQRLCLLLQALHIFSRSKLIKLKSMLIHNMTPKKLAQVHRTVDNYYHFFGPTSSFLGSALKLANSTPDTTECGICVCSLLCRRCTRGFAVRRQHVLSRSILTVCTRCRYTHHQNSMQMTVANRSADRTR